MKQCRRKGPPQKKSGSGSFSMINKDAAGIDIGSGEHWVAVPEDRDEEPVRCFGWFTADLQAMRFANVRELKNGALEWKQLGMGSYFEILM